MYTQQGLRVLAYGYKELDAPTDSSVQQLTQDELEQGLSFGGLILLANALKPETPSTIRSLVDGGIDVRMITGDHVQTAVAVAFQCGILQSSKDVCIIDLESKSHDTHASSPFSTSFRCTITNHDGCNTRTVSIDEVLNAAEEGSYDLAVTGT
jgi:magnesium-transporting ATPase (P-type)